MARLKKMSEQEQFIQVLSVMALRNTLEGKIGDELEFLTVPETKEYPRIYVFGPFHEYDRDQTPPKIDTSSICFMLAMGDPVKYPDEILEHVAIIQKTRYELALHPHHVLTMELLPAIKAVKEAWKQREDNDGETPSNNESVH